MRRSVRKSESAWLQSQPREENRKKRKVYLEKWRPYLRAVQRAKREYEPRLRMKLEENACSNGFGKEFVLLVCPIRVNSRLTWKRYKTTRVRSKLGMMLWRCGGLIFIYISVGW